MPSFYPDSLLGKLEQHAHDFPDKVLYTLLRDQGPPETLTFGELLLRVRAIAAHLREQFNQGDRAVLIYPFGLEFICAYLGCLAAGVIAVPAFPPRKNRKSDRLTGMVADCTPTVLLTDKAVLNTISPDLVNVPVLATDDWQVESAPHWDPNLIRSDTVAFLQYTSGSTGTPKGVVVTHGNIVCNEKLITAGFGYHSFRESQPTTNISWLPMFHDMGLIGSVLQPLYLGFHSILMSPTSFVSEPIRWLQAISDYRGTSTVAPNFAFDHCVRGISAEQKSGIDLSSLRTVCCGSEPIRAASLDRFTDEFFECGFRKQMFFPCYGMAEATLLVSTAAWKHESDRVYLDGKALEAGQVRVVDRNSPSAKCIVNCGYSGIGVTVEVVDPKTRARTDENQVGEIWIKADCVAAGYWNRPAETQEAFQNWLPDSDEGPFLATGDLGFVADGCVYITGRLKDVIIIRGRKIYPQDIEAVVEKSAAFVPPNGCAAFSLQGNSEERLGLVVESNRSFMRLLQRDDPESTRVLDDIKSVVACEFDVSVSQISVVKPGTFPRTTSGKVQRSKCRQLFEEGKLSVVWSSDQLSLANSLRDDLPAGQNNGKSTPNKTSASHQTATLSDNAQRGSEHRADSVIEWLRGFSKRRLNSFVADERRTLAPHTILEIGNKGLLGMQAPENVGGLNLTTFDTMRVMEQLAAIDMSLASVVGIHNGLGLRPILRFGSSELKSEFVPSLASGRQLASFALTEPVSGSNPLAMQSFARPDGTGWKLTAHKQWIGLAQWAGTINVFARMLNAEGQGMGTIGITVPESHPQLRHGAESLTLGLKGIVQSDVFVDEGLFESKYVLGTPGDGFGVAQDAMMFCRLGIAAESLGIMKRCYQLMLTYASGRNISTGRLLDNPVTIHRMEEMLLGISALESMVYGVSKLLDAGETVSTEVYTACKILAPELAWKAADQLVQCLGGRGYTESNLAPRIFRDTRLLRIFEGPTEALQMFLGSSVVQQFEKIRLVLTSYSGNEQIAVRLQDDVSSLTNRSGSTPAERQWLYQHVGLLASWAVLNVFSKSQLRPSSFTSSEVQAWVLRQYDRALEAAHNQSSYHSVSHTTPILLSTAGKAFEASIGDIQESLPVPSMTMDPWLLPSRNEPEASSLAHDNLAYRQASNRQASSTKTHIRNQVRSIVLGWLQSEIDSKTTQVDDHRKFGAMGVDSVAAVSLTVSLEKAFGISLPDGLLFQHQCIDELVAFLENEVPSPDNFEIGLAETLEEREAVYRFRYAVYVEEMNRPQRYADHEGKRITDPLDDHADIFAIRQGNSIVGTVRVNPLQREPLDEYRKIYGIENLTEDDLAVSSISTRIMLAPQIRQSPLGGRLLVAAYSHGRQLGIKYDYCDCNDPVLDFFKQIGYRFVRRVQHPEYGEVNVMRLDLEDIAYLTSIGSPLANQHLSKQV